VGGSLADLNAANRYTYAGDDPINAVDPSGEFSTPGFLESCVGPAIGAAVITSISLFFGIVSAPASLPAGGFVFVSALFACIGGEATYSVVEAIIAAFGG
jgi:hypothetical protein